MVNQHGERDCAHRRTKRFGGRRRRCTACGVTWRIRPRRRGPKRRPRRIVVLTRTFRDPLTLVQIARLRRWSITAVKERQRGALDAALRQPWPARIPRGRLILVSDGLWFAVDDERWVAYLCALRSIRSTRVVFLRPILKPGHECEERWREVVEGMSPSLHHRIPPWVSDSVHGVEVIAAEHGWVLQRCHAHLLRRVADVMGTRKRLRWLAGRRLAAARIQELIAADDPRAAPRSLRRLVCDPNCPTKVRGVIRAVLRRHGEYRSYLTHPDLRLPTTTNTVEGMNARIRELAGRSRGFRTQAALERWIIGFVRCNLTAKCRPKQQPK